MPGPNLISLIQKRTQIYESLTPDEKAEVDTFNASIRGKSVAEIIRITDLQADGRHPFVKYEERAERTQTEDDTLTGPKF